MSFSTFPIALPNSTKSDSLNSPSYLPRRDLSIDRICSVRAFVFTPMDGIDTRIGNSSAFGVVVNGTMTTVPRRRLKRVSEKITHGRVLACSWPMTGSSRVQYTSPRRSGAVMPCAALWMLLSVRLGQWPLRAKTFRRRNPDPSRPRTRLNPHLPNALLPEQIRHHVLRTNSWPHTQQSFSGLPVPVRAAPDRPGICCAAGWALCAPAKLLHHQANVAIPALVGEYECLA